MERRSFLNRRGFRDMPIRRKLAALMLLSTAVGLGFAAAGLIGYTWQESRANAGRDLETVARITANSATAALAFEDTRTAGEMLAALRAKPDIELACLYGGVRSALFASYSPRGHVCPVEAPPAGSAAQLNALTLVQPVSEGTDRIGWLYLRQHLDGLRDAVAAQIGLTLAILAGSFFLSVSIAWRMQRMLADPLLRLAAVARQVSDTRNYALRAAPYGRDEIGRLVDDFNQMLDQIALRDTEIAGARDALTQQVREKSAANQELELAVERLKETQSQLVQSERLASLGGLVAGVAHEINTPVGVGVTAASTLQARAALLRRRYDKGELTPSDLNRFVEVADESTQIILKNLQRAADLIHSFKQVAVDQSSGERRRFALRDYIDEVLLSLAPRLKKAGHAVEVSCPRDLVVDIYPGALAQILTNLVSNSMLHAFAPGERGALRIRVTAAGGWVSLRYADDGCGIPAEHIGRIYDPFFTTKRGAGGSGLGLNIVYNLVTRALGGTIEVNSIPGRGAEFLVQFPLHAQDVQAAVPASVEATA